MFRLHFHVHFLYSFPVEVSLPWLYCLCLSLPFFLSIYNFWIPLTDTSKFERGVKVLNSIVLLQMLWKQMPGRRNHLNAPFAVKLQPEFKFTIAEASKQPGCPPSCLTVGLWSKTYSRPCYTHWFGSNLEWNGIEEEPRCRTEAAFLRLRVLHPTSRWDEVHSLVQITKVART